MDRAQRIGEREDAGEDRQHHRVRGLGEEQAGDPLDVVDDPSALGDDGRQRREVGVHQHELGDAACGLAARRHRHAAVGVLQREHVVDAVAGHRDGVAARLQGADHRPLLVRGARDRTRCWLRPRRRTPRCLLPASCVASTLSSQPSSPARRATAPTVTLLSPLITLTVDALIGEVLQRLGRVAADDVFEQHERDGRDSGQRCVCAVAERRRRWWRARARADLPPRASRRCRGSRRRSQPSARSRARRAPSCRGRRRSSRSTCARDENGTRPVDGPLGRRRVCVLQRT